ncbi:MAG: DUF655 domain-containing protein [Cyanobacteria bacterium P01_A01_bin.84]
MFSTKRLFYKFFLLTFILYGCVQVKSSTSTLKPLPQDPFIKVYFNYSQSSQYEEEYGKRKRHGDNLEGEIINTISRAQSSVDLAVQELNLPKIAEALVERHKAGVKVRVILEHQYSRSWSRFSSSNINSLSVREKKRYQEFQHFTDINKDSKLSLEELKQRDALVILQDAKIPVIDDTADGSKGSGLMHHKFLLVDNRIVIVSSANFTRSGIHGDTNKIESLGNANNLLKIDSPKLASLFQEEFNLMWGDGVGKKLDSKFGLKKLFRKAQKITLGKNKITLKFSPVSPTLPWLKTSNGLIGKTLADGEKAIDLALFVFSEQRLANILEKRHLNKIKIRALIEKDFAYRSYSEGLDMMGVALSQKCKYEPDNQPWSKPINTVGVPILSEGDLLHHKFSVIDGKEVITGSHNWSDAANYKNDETLLIIENPVVAAHYIREFERLYKNSSRGIPRKVQEKIQSQNKQCPKIITPSKEKNISLVNPNTATLEELQSLPGIGKKLAKQIILTREQKPFISVADLERVPGIGSKMRYKLGSRITFDKNFDRVNKN